MKTFVFSFLILLLNIHLVKSAPKNCAWSGSSGQNWNTNSWSGCNSPGGSGPPQAGGKIINKKR
jgi:hypothetical protein